ncbi:xanthine dehydrogenase family protein molybdopterin-binding subunit [Roseibacterium sp. SDUM158017]|uniref:xanthine dehydrogenase family protein molybdopterin-binding subunit n=1 Tax=Roseicyclus salinarum TaxID=3036773 RepID=UPI0024156DE6|nr:xanthine dehydrogenase family protein molybdopterin-binding subunit [Roseibacterium sp. SDUM158017]MDG4647403.1 xanthine dehydrogenase family protein molybdopterin-binding subunit [Roseibacterium sp. SDUM158017]
MTKFGSSQPVKRLEDTRFLTGHGRYIDDQAPQGSLRAYVLRSTMAHGEITTLDADEARDAPGVVAVYTAADLAEKGMKNSMKGSIVPNRDGTKGAAPVRPILAEGRVRHVGEPVAFVVAETLEQARDAAELIEVEIDDLAVKLDIAPGGATVHAEAPDNVAYEWAHGDEEATDAALKGSAHVVTLTTHDNRIIVNSLEPRGCFAELEDGRLHVAINGQGVWGHKDDLVAWFGLGEDDVRVTNPDVGGGFGMKSMRYPEHFLVALAARELDRPVHWMGDRSESMLSDNAGRDLDVTCTLGFDADYRLTAYHVDSLSNLGAYNSQFGQNIQSALFAKVLTGTYDVQNVFFRNRGVYTNTTQVDAYRGAGRPEAIYALERAIDFAARELGVDPVELRRKNFIKPEQFPYKSATGELYDVGNFPKLLDRAVVEADIAGFEDRRAGSFAQGRLRGLGICYYIESILGSPDETATIELTGDGAKVYVGTQSNGQGHETVFAQLLNDQTGLPLDKIEVVQGDSDLIKTGGGTGGSRSVTVQGTAMRATGDALIGGLTEFLSDDLDARDVSFDAEEGVFRAPGSNVVVTLLEAAEKARAAGKAELTKVTRTTTLPGRSYPNGCHVAEVEIDRDTGETRVVRYTVVDDFGNLMNPMLAEGQVHGGVAQGIGQAISERVVYDETGQLLTASFMDYGMPRATDTPFVAFYTEPVPSIMNPLGMKGCGEAGTVGALAAVANAVQDALWDLGIRQVDMPFTPSRVWAMLNEGERRVAAE